MPQSGDCACAGSGAATVLRVPRTVMDSQPCSIRILLVDDHALFQTLEGCHTQKFGNLRRVISSNPFGFLYLLEDCQFSRFGNLDPQMATLILLTVDCR
jgi:hypothetical protein